MKLFLLSLWCITLSISNINGFSISGRIANGHKATPFIAPYIVSIQKLDILKKYASYRHSCGGAIIDSHHVLTAAHCLSEVEKIGEIIIKAGRYNIRSDNEVSEQSRKVHYYRVHEKYTGGVAPNDIAIIYVEKPFIFNNYIQPIQLPKTDSNYSGLATLFGWGLLSESYTDWPMELQTAKIPLIPNDECVKHLKSSGSILQATNICTISVDGKGACSSDSGGPLVKENNQVDEIIGIVSWSPYGCDKAMNPSVYVRVSSFLDWINKAKEDFEIMSMEDA